MKLVSVTEMRQIEAAAEKSGVTYAQMMERAGAGLAGMVIERMGDEVEHHVLGLVGPGNNGGDTLVALERLARAGWTCQAYLIDERKNDPLVARVIAAGGEIFTSEHDDKYTQLGQSLEQANIILDGLLGTGSRLPLREEYVRLLVRVKKTRPEDARVVAVDCPSGVDCETGAADAACLPADLTVCMAAVKTGLLCMPAFSLTGELAVVDIGLPVGLDEWKQIRSFVVTQEDVYAMLPARPLDAHKGTFGTAMLVAGSVNYPGAAALAARAAYRVGTGLVRLAIPGAIYNPLVASIPEAVFVLLPHEMGVISADAFEVAREYFADSDALLVGPGLGLEDTSRVFIEKLITGHQTRANRGAIGFIGAGPDQKKPGNSPLPPLVIDADGLKLLAGIEDWWKKIPMDTILTPHPGEMSVLTGIPAAEIQQDRLATARHWSARWGSVVILKGAFTVVAAPDGSLAVIPVAAPALATAGTGDVLAGTVAGLRAQGMKAFEAAVAGAWLHAKAGEYAGWQIGSSAGVLASEVAEALPLMLPPD
ncbi:MAG: NAD(P)H-hydrate dehydratase [Anaerolineae bacterium]|nr:NAD(P)H-hydrate dehydratase [Anaerolineae bacterium]